jgi:hypothetical protein
MFTSLSLVEFRAVQHSRCMKFLGFLAAAALAALTSTFASADVDVLNTGTPTGSGGPVELNNGTIFAVEFQLNAGQSLTSVSTYFTQGDVSTGSSFDYFIYANPLSRNEVASANAAELWSGTPGWDSSTNLSFTAQTTGDYWLAIEGTSSQFLYLPGLSSATAGSTPALGFETKSGANWVTTTADYGVEITATPEPSAWALALVGVGAFVYIRARRQNS